MILFSVDLNKKEVRKKVTDWVTANMNNLVNLGEVAISITRQKQEHQGKDGADKESKKHYWLSRENTM